MTCKRLLCLFYSNNNTNRGEVLIAYSCIDMLNLREIKIHNGPQGRYKTVVSHISSSYSLSYLSVQLHVLDIVLAINECMLKKDKLM